MPTRDTSNTVAVVGFVLSFFLTLPGLICSIIGYHNAVNGADHKGLAVVGIIICILSIILEILLLVFYFSTIYALIVKLLSETDTENVVRRILATI